MDVIRRIRNFVTTIFRGNEHIVNALIATVIAEGHALLIGPVGSGKTTLGKALAVALGGSFKRVQVTNETLPSDIVGYSAYTPTGDVRIVKGPIFANVVLMDEINRAPPRTLSALLEAMQERQVTLEGYTFELPRPHIIIGTMNLTEVELGFTNPLPYAVLDRFMTCIYVDYTRGDSEVEIVSSIDHIEKALLNSQGVVSIKDVAMVIEDVRGVYVDRTIVEYMHGIIEELRRDARLSIRLSTRAFVHLYKLSRALAYLDERDFVLPDDVKLAVQLALPHRLVIRPEYKGSTTVHDILKGVLEKVPVPHIVYA